MAIAKKHIFSFVFLIAFSLLNIVSLLPAPAHADQTLITGQTGFSEIGSTAYGKTAAPTDIRVTIARIISIVLGFVGVIFFALIIFSGFQYMTSAGNEDQTKKALGLLRNAIIGLVIILVAWMITRYAITVLGKAVNNNVDLFYNPS